jgi:outer membrane lipoprotein LolB
MSRPLTFSHRSDVGASVFLPAVLLAIVLLVSACQTTAIKTKSAYVVPSWPQRAAHLQAIEQYEFRGRVAAVSGSQSVSAALNWQQQGADSHALLRAPFGLGELDMAYRGGVLKVSTSDGRSIEGEAADQALTQLLGFSPPLGSIRYWLLGCNDPASSAETVLDAEQRLLQLTQNGWQVEYPTYMQSNNAQWLPKRLNITREGQTLKVAVERWILP